MRNVIDCINAFIPLLSTEYELVLGRKGVAVTLRILFDKKDCFHLMGLQYLVDRPELSRDRGKVFDEIADGTIAIEKIESSDFYKKIEQRIHFLPLLEQIIALRSIYHIMVIFGRISIVLRSSRNLELTITMLRQLILV